MGLHLLACSQDFDTGAQPIAMNFVTDNVLGLSGLTGVILPQRASILAAWAGSPNMRLARLDANRLLQRGTAYLRPLTRGGSAPSTGVGIGGEQNIASLLDSPPVLLENDVLSLYVRHDFAASQRVRGLIWLGFDVKPVPPGEAAILRYTSTMSVTTSDAWVALTGVTWSEIPDGVYAIVGHEHRSASNVASRLIVPGQAWRPGSPGIAGLVADAAGLRTHRMFYDGRMGIWGTFPGCTHSPPPLPPEQAVDIA